MSFIDLATLTMHRRNELDGRINQFVEKCDHAINEIKKMKMKARGFVLRLNCDPSELKERFLTCMKELDEFTYLVTDFNLSAGKLEEIGNSDDTPVPDSTNKHVPNPPLQQYNLLDALSEPSPSTSTACSNFHPPEKPKRIPKEEQTLIVFSSNSCSAESVPQVKVVSKEVQCVIEEGMNNLNVTEDTSYSKTPCKLPAQTILEVDQSYIGTIMHVDGLYFWVITEDIDGVFRLMTEMTDYYSKNSWSMSLKEIKSLAYCAFFDEDCFYRGLFLNLTEDCPDTAEIFTVDTGETRTIRIEHLQPLVEQFCVAPPYARCCHLAGVEMVSYHDKQVIDRLEDVVKEYKGRICSIKIDDNSSESLGVYVTLPTKEVLNEIVVHEGLAKSIDKPNTSQKINSSQNRGPIMIEDSELDITQCPEHEDPVEAVTGYHNRDEADICKHYNGGPEKTCFKGARCTKKHIMKHPDGWTLDRVEVIAGCRLLPLPEPGSWHKVIVTCVCHFDRVYVQFVDKKITEEIPDFGVVLPPMTLPGLVRDMNSPASKLAYKPLKITPAPGEMVAALYPLDACWYRARVLSLTRADQSVEVMYVDYGTVMWVKEDQVRMLEPRWSALPAQALRCVLAGVLPRDSHSQHWAQAKRALHELTRDKPLDAHVISRNYDEITVEMYDPEGYSIAEQLAATNLVKLTEYSLVEDNNVQRKVVVP